MFSDGNEIHEMKKGLDLDLLKKEIEVQKKMQEENIFKKYFFFKENKIILLSLIINLFVPL